MTHLLAGQHAPFHQQLGSGLDMMRMLADQVFGAIHQAPQVGLHEAEEVRIEAQQLFHTLFAAAGSQRFVQAVAIRAVVSRDVASCRLAPPPQGDPRA